MPIEYPSSTILNCPTWWTPDFSTAPIWWTEKEKKQVREEAAALRKILPVGNPNRLPGLLLWGPPGRAKTAAALFLAYDWGKAGKLSVFQDFEEFMVKIRSAWRKDANPTVEQLEDALYKPDFLIIDDIGKRATPETQETLGNLINGRINRGKVTVSTTNCLLDPAADGGAGVKEFIAACDSRVLERYSEADLAIGKLTANLRRKP